MDSSFITQDRNEYFEGGQGETTTFLASTIAWFQQIWCQMKEMDIIFPLISHESVMSSGFETTIQQSFSRKNQ